jgi:hypothetical protein
MRESRKAEKPDSFKEMSRNRIYSMITLGRRNADLTEIRHPVLNSLPFALCALLLFSGCGSSTRPPRAIGFPSYAEAEAGTVIILDGGNSYDPEEKPVGCVWQESVENPEINLIPDEVQKNFYPDNCTISITPTVEGEYIFQLKVSDMIPGHKESEADLVSLLITPPPPSPNPPPVAIAKADLTRVSTGETVIITGEESFDQAGGSLTYFWTEDYQNPVTGLVSPGSVTQAVAFTQPGGYRFELTVSNGPAWSRPNSVRINVDSRVDRVPTADAGEDRNVSYLEEVRLSGDKSSDPDGDQITYRWTQTAGPPVQLSPSAEVKEISFTVPDEILAYSFSLVVSDGQLASAPDTVTVRVWEHSTDNVPDAVWVDRFYPYLDSSGSRIKPYRKIQDGINAAYAYPGAISDVYIARGSYDKKVTVANGISLYGGFDPLRSWERDPQSWPTFILPGADFTALSIPTSVATKTYIDGLRIFSLPRSSQNTYGIECYSSAIIFKRNWINGGGGGEATLAGFSIGLGIKDSSPMLINNIIQGGNSPNNNWAIWLITDILNPKETNPIALNNYIDGGGVPDGSSTHSYGIHIGTRCRATLINNIINPGLGSVITTDNRYGIFESNGSANTTEYCPDSECNPILFNNDIIKNDPDATLYYDDDNELATPTQTDVRILSTISQVNELGDQDAKYGNKEDYSKNNLDTDPIFVGKENGDYHLSASFDYPGGPTEPAETSPLIDAGIDAGVRFDFDLQPRPECLITGAAGPALSGTEGCFDIGPDEVYLNY